MNVINTKSLSIPQTTPPIPPSLNVPFVKPRTYEFRVAETIDDAGKIIKVGLQIQEWEHDEWGTASLIHAWCDVPRVVLNKDGVLVLK